MKPANFKKWMNNLSRVGMAKSCFSLARSHGFDLSDEKQSNAFLGMYNAGLLGGGGLPAMPSDIDLSLLGGLPGTGTKSKKERDKARHKRKLARALYKRAAGGNDHLMAFGKGLSFQVNAPQLAHKKDLAKFYNGKSQVIQHLGANTGIVRTAAVDSVRM
ncbi:MAG: hypothetical protein JNJ50_31740 [Acidobacteria bacterium]|nr:hypothetical protein [Acidobacteriota bacterium]